MVCLQEQQVLRCSLLHSDFKQAVAMSSALKCMHAADHDKGSRNLMHEICIACMQKEHLLSRCQADFTIVYRICRDKPWQQSWCSSTYPACMTQRWCSSPSFDHTLVWVQGLHIFWGSPKGTSSSLFQEQSTTASPFAPIKSLSSFDTQELPLGLRITPGKGMPSRSSETTFCLTNLVPVHRFLSHCPRSHMDSLKGIVYSCLASSLPSGLTELLV